MKKYDHITHGWDAFKYGERQNLTLNESVIGTSSPPRSIMRRASAASLTATIFNRIAIDCAMVDIRHVQIDKKTLNETERKSYLNDCFTVEANVDQSSVAFFQDLVYSMFDEGVIAVVPVETTTNPMQPGTYDINQLRVGRITQWFPKKVRVELYNDRNGLRQEVVLDKSMVAILENPLYAIMNGPNSTLQRLRDKMSLLDKQDSDLVGGKIDMILQLPHVIKTDKQREEANARLNNIHKQMTGARYGIAYVEATEKITQLNRPIVDNLSEQVNNLKQELYNQLGLTENIFTGKATEAEMRIYYDRTIDPLIAYIIKEFIRKFLTKTARTQGQTFVYRRNPFKLIPASMLAEIADKMTRNAILTPNEVRGILGFAPNNQPESDKLLNRNIADKNQQPGSGVSPDSNQNDSNTQTEGES